MSVEYDFDFGIQRKSQETPLANTSVYIALVILIAVTAFFVGMLYEKRTSTASTANMTTFWEVWDILERDYYGEIPSTEQRRWGATQGLISTLNDPYTSYAPPELAAVRREEIEGHFGGIGVVIRINEAGQIMVVDAVPGNPAAEGGVQRGDIFLEVNGQSVVSFSTDQVANLVKGEIGTDVTITFLRPETEEEYTVVLTRAIIETPTVSSQNIEGIGYLDLASFNGVATSQMQTNLTNLLEEDVYGLILDLRGNGGGLLDQAVSIADIFLDKGVILTEKTAADETEIFESKDGDLGESLPLVVLVDSSTASASEVVAGALQDRDRAVLIGSRTFGKGVVQLVYNLSDGSQLRVTNAAWFTPNDRPINGIGLTPDQEVIETFDNFGNDLVLQAALDYLNEHYTPEEVE